MEKLISAIRYLHSQDIIHRDLKPDNFIYKTKDPNSELKIIDFGLSTKIERGSKLKDIVGTPAYLAPEVLLGNYGKSADSWSLGVIMFVMLTGRHPFQGYKGKELFKAILKQPIDEEEADWCTLSSDAKDLLRRLLEKSSRDRIKLDEALSHPWFN
jgi:calcium-dependent protein kinase